MSLKYEPVSEPLHISVKKLFVSVGYRGYKQTRRQTKSSVAEPENGLDFRGVHLCTYRGTSVIRNSTLPQDHRRALGIVLL